jgi:FkbM family methyltransferase
MYKNTARLRRFEIGEWGVDVKEYLPPRLKSFCVDMFFRFMPISLICLLWKELDGYFKLRIPQKGDVVVDAGAWTGHFTIVAARLVGPHGRVVTIEPQKVMCERLENRLRRLGLKTVVTVVNAALFDRTSERRVRNRNTPGFNVFDQTSDTERTELVNLRTLDDILATLGVRQVDFIKMDIEGAELEALVGMHSTLSSMHPFLAIASYHVRDGGKTSSRVEEILRSFSYSARTGHPWHLTTWGWDNADRKAATLAESTVGGL